MCLVEMISLFPVDNCLMPVVERLVEIALILVPDCDILARDEHIAPAERHGDSAAAKRGAVPAVLDFVYNCVFHRAQYP